MDTESLRAVLIVLAVFALIIGVVLKFRALRSGTRPRGRTDSTAPARPKRFKPAPSGGPQPRERWWVDFPHQDDPGASKARPCLVLGHSGTGYWVLKCTTQAPREAHWRVPVGASRWQPPSDKDGYVDLVPFHLPKARFERRLGTLGSAKTQREIEGRVRWERAWDFTA